MIPMPRCRVKHIEEWETTIEERLSRMEYGSPTDPNADEWPE